MIDQINILAAEKAEIIEEIRKGKIELDDLLRRLNSKRKVKFGKEEEIAELEAQIDRLYDKMELLEEEINIKNAIIADLQRELDLLLNRKPKQERPKNQFYVPVKNDMVDEKLAEYINEVSLGTPVPWKRMSEGNYMYGTKKVSVKYMRNHLIIKVGGGSMMVEEFVANYEDIELAKMNY